ncbi:hypothetical protein FHL15_005554 [Xylaria flabelliformis]|uniref:Uncharacterized protein n=1 Tax=Xylaria flabelliformis TaxID=2512241 RepID=A0A553I058_9PEZI|nr:hypothetical protein FHL15_005554 [Xylaria flabelliformis]
MHYIPSLETPHIEEPRHGYYIPKTHSRAPYPASLDNNPYPFPTVAGWHIVIETVWIQGIGLATWPAIVYEAIANTAVAIYEVLQVYSKV